MDKLAAPSASTRSSSVCATSSAPAPSLPTGQVLGERPGPRGDRALHGDPAAARARARGDARPGHVPRRRRQRRPGRGPDAGRVRARLQEHRVQRGVRRLPPGPRHASAGPEGPAAEVHSAGVECGQGLSDRPRPGRQDRASARADRAPRRRHAASSPRARRRRPGRRFMGGGAVQLACQGVREELVPPRGCAPRRTGGITLEGGRVLADGVPVAIEDLLDEPVDGANVPPSRDDAAGRAGPGRRPRDVRVRRPAGGGRGRRGARPGPGGPDRLRSLDVAGASTRRPSRARARAARPRGSAWRSWRRSRSATA